MADGQWQWTGSPASIYESNPGVRRHFCATCGTPIAYQSDRYPGETHFYVAALEHSTGFEPKGHVNFAEHLDWFDVRDDLPRKAATDK